MSLRLWTAEDTSVSLGPTLPALRAFSDLAAAIGEREGEFAELLGVTQTNDETLPPEYVAKIAAQADTALRDFAGLDDHTKWLLGEIAKLGRRPVITQEALRAAAVLLSESYP